MKRALITGVTGQDGPYLAQFLLERGYEVYGMYRRTSSLNFWRLNYLEIYDSVHLFSGDLTDMPSILEIVSSIRPHEIYNLAAQSFVEASFEKPVMTANVDGIGPLNFLEVVRNVDPEIRFYQASSSEIYGNVNQENIPINETTEKNPVSPYAASKLFAYHLTKIYREGYGLFAANGILFNHESPLRGLEFVTRKISNQVARIYHGLDDSLYLGNMRAFRDWGYAREYVEAMWMMLNQDEPDDFVIATGEAHSVQEFVESAFSFIEKDWQAFVKHDTNLERPVELVYLCGDPKKAKEKMGWEPKTHFDKLVELMVKEDIDRWGRVLRGEQFPWDASYFSAQKKESINSRLMRRRGNV